jgi:4-hydroxy-2-oxoheptanedioate aldolase
MRMRESVALLVASAGVLAGMPQDGATAPDGARLNRTIELLSAAQPTFGIFSHDRSLENARAISRSGLDFVLIDMEHGPMDIETLRVFLLGMTDKARILAKGSLQMDVTPIVRIAPNGRDQTTFVAKQVLDVGAMGVMFPYVNTAAEAEMAVRSMRYPQRRGSADMEPLGIRGSGAGNATWFWGVPNYSELADVWPLDPKGELLSVIQIETVEAVANVDAILAVPGISAIFVGPADLSLSLGVPGNSPEVEAAIQTVLRAARARNMPIGITTGAGTVAQRVKEGFNFVTVGFGDGGITPATAQALERGREAAGRK